MVFGFVLCDEVMFFMVGVIVVINFFFFEGWSIIVEEVKVFGKWMILFDILVYRE